MSLLHWLAYLSLSLPLYISGNRDALSLLLACLGGALINNILKIYFHRVRPEWEHWVIAHGFSFPSGHSIISTAFYGMLGYLIWVHLKEQGKPANYVFIITSVIIVCIGLSRIYLGVHYATDVLGGFTVGGIWLLSTRLWPCNGCASANKNRNNSLVCSFFNMK